MKVTKANMAYAALAIAEKNLNTRGRERERNGEVFVKMRNSEENYTILFLGRRDTRMHELIELASDVEWSSSKGVKERVGPWSLYIVSAKEAGGSMRGPRRRASSHEESTTTAL